MKRLLIVLLFVTTLAWGQARPEEDAREIQIWMGGGHGLSGRTSDTGVWNAGLRYGWILTGPHGPGFLRGNFEYAVDAVPIFWVFQPRTTAFGFGLNPLNLKWNFSSRSRVSPYVELSGGTLFTNHSVPEGTSKINFTSGAALGVHLLRDTYNWSIEARYMHISNAGLETPNPGINTFQVRLGLGRFTPGKEARKHRRGKP